MPPPVSSRRPELLTLSCDEVNGASGAQIFRMSTMQHAAYALTPLSLWPRMLAEQSSFATFVNESLCSQSWSSSVNSFARVSSLLCSSAVGIGLPARHDNGWLNRRPSLSRSSSCCSSSGAGSAALLRRDDMMRQVSLSIAAAMRWGQDRIARNALQLNGRGWRVRLEKGVPIGQLTESKHPGQSARWLMSGEGLSRSEGAALDVKWTHKTGSGWRPELWVAGAELRWMWIEMWKASPACGPKERWVVGSRGRSPKIQKRPALLPSLGLSCPVPLRDTSQASAGACCFPTQAIKSGSISVAWNEGNDISWFMPCLVTPSNNSGFSSADCLGIDWSVATCAGLSFSSIASFC